jgi:ATP-binding cassette subfamily F protein uup
VTLQTLEEFLDEFRGCVLIVSHDRYFMDRLVDHVFAFEGEGAIKDYPGTYSDYRVWKKEQETEEKELQKNMKAVASGPPADKEVKEEAKTAPVKKLSFKLQHELKELETGIPELESKKRELEERLASGITNYAEISELTSALKQVSDLIDEKTLRWLEIQEEL